MSDEADDAGRDAARRRTRRWVGATFGAGFVLVALGMLAGYRAAARHPRPGHHHLSAGGLVAILAAVALVMGLTALLLWWLLRRPDYQRAMRFSWRRRMRVAKALRRGDPIPPEELAVAESVVAVLRNQKLFYGTQLLLIVTWMMQAYLHHGYLRWLFVGISLAMGSALVHNAWTRRRSLRNWQLISRGTQPEPG